MPRERIESMGGIRLASNADSTYGDTLVFDSAPSARAVSTSPTWASTSERNRFIARLLVFMAFAMSMLPTGTRDVIAVSMTPSQVITAMTDPAPLAIAHVETGNAPGSFFARLAEVAPAATIIAA